MDLEIYGGNPQVVASFEEMQRASLALSQAADHLEQAIQQPQHYLFDLLPNPVPQIQLLFLLPSLIDRARKLSFHCRMAADAYFSTEARVILLMEQTLLPLTEIRAFISDANPISQASADVLTKTAAAFAVLGLTGKPNLSRSALVSTAATLLTTAGGYKGIPHMLATINQNNQALGLFAEKLGSATLTSIAKTVSSSDLAGAAAKLQRSYGPLSSVRIEVFSHGWGRQFIVYVPGTQSLSLAGSNPLNIRSTLTALGGLSAPPSQTAVLSALDHLKAGPSDRVTFIGHSQGALVAANIAQQPQHFGVSGLVSFGGPISHLDLKVPTIALAHQGDPVSVLGGGVNPMRDNWVSVSASGDFENLVEAHAMNGYIKTAQLLETHQDEGLRRVSSQIFSEKQMTGLEYVFEIRSN